MSHKENKRHEEKASGFKKNDLILVLLVFAAASIFFAGHLFTSQKSAGVVEIQIDGKVVETLDLQKERAFKINGGTNTVQIENGKVKMAAANCPDQICVHQKAISRNGESIICLPNKIVRWRRSRTGCGDELRYEEKYSQNSVVWCIYCPCADI